MKALIQLFIILLATGLHAQKPTDQLEKYESIANSNYELEKPKIEIQAVLVLFGGYPEVASDIRREFDILDMAKQHSVAVVYSNFSRRLWLEQDERSELATQVRDLFGTHDLPRDNVYFGGFSSGGNVALLIASHLVGNRSNLMPKGVFIVDSPLDLAALYRTAEKNVRQGFSEGSAEEGRFIIQTLGDRFGDPRHNLDKYERYSAFTFNTGNISNLNSLRNVKLRFYTEPDTLWWKTNRNVDYEQTNAFYIAELAGVLKSEGFEHAQYMPTRNRGYRANGMRHPHSWSIVEPEGLIKWMLEK